MSIATTEEVSKKSNSNQTKMEVDSWLRLTCLWVSKVTHLTGASEAKFPLEGNMFESNNSSEQILAFRLRASVLSGCLLFFSEYNVDLLLAAQTLVMFLFAQVRAILGNPGYALSPHKTSIPC